MRRDCLIRGKLLGMKQQLYLGMTMIQIYLYLYPRNLDIYTLFIRFRYLYRY